MFWLTLTSPSSAAIGTQTNGGAFKRLLLSFALPIFYAPGKCLALSNAGLSLCRMTQFAMELAACTAPPALINFSSIGLCETIDLRSLCLPLLAM